jgi:ADP-heptose:LPS heptosyltransferase
MNILVVRTDKLGDFITALPAMYVLKQYNKQNKIIACVAPINKPLAQSCDFIDEVIVDEGTTSVLHLASKIRTAKIDVSITFFSNTRVALAQYLAKIPIRIAPATKLAQIFYNRRVKQKRSQVKMTEFEYNLELTRELFNDISLEFKTPLVTFSDAQKEYERFCTEHNISKEVMVFHVGFGGSSDANFDTQEYEYLIRGVLEKNKYQVVLTFGPDEIELYKEMQKRLKNEDVVFYHSVEGLLTFAKIISKCKLFISTSTGTYHLASLVGTATMTFFGDSKFASASRWKSVGDEKLQIHYMLPQDKEKRHIMLEEVRERLKNY